MYFLYDAHFHLNYLTNYSEKIQSALKTGIMGGLIAGVWNVDFIYIINNYLLQTEFLFFHNKSSNIVFKPNKFTCFLAHGLHPAYVHLNWLNEQGMTDINKIQNDIEQFKTLIKEKRELLWAIGETGFDLSREVLQHSTLMHMSKEEILELQNTAFDVCVEQALLNDLPLIVHSRNAWNHTLNKLKEAKMKGIRNIMIHCYGGPAQDLNKLEKLNIYCSFGGVTTWKHSRKIQESFKKCSPTLRLIETDSPDLSPEFPDGSRAKENEPRNLLYIAQQLSEYLGVSLEEFSAQINANFLRYLLN